MGWGFVLVSNTTKPQTTKLAPRARYWLLTLPHHVFVPFLPDNCSYIKGQLEKSNGTSYLHWQVMVIFMRDVRLATVKSIFGTECHAEVSRSVAAEDYVWKEDTRVDGTQFELGKKPIKKNSQRDWDAVWALAKLGEIDLIDKNVLVPHYSAIKRIRQDYLDPLAIVKRIHVFWGRTGMGKSRLAWEQAGFGAYPKDPRSKFWDGYRGQENVVIDEVICCLFQFRGDIDIAHILRWFDRYPVIVEVKGTSTCLAAKTIWVTSNLHPRAWYPNLDDDTLAALLRRLDITHFDGL